MKFLELPEGDSGCDLTTNFTDCIGERRHLIIYGIGAFIHFAAICFGLFVLLRRGNVENTQGSLPGRQMSGVGSGRRFVGQPMRALSICMAGFITTRLVQNTLCAFDIVNLMAVRTAGVVVSCWFGFWGLLVFTAGIVETVQQTTGRLPGQNRPRLHERLLVRIPSRRFTLSFLAVMGVIGTVATAVLAGIGGWYGDQGQWDEHYLYVCIAWTFWGAIFSFLGAFYAYYAGMLTMTLRQLMPELRPTVRPHSKISYAPQSPYGLGATLGTLQTDGHGYHYNDHDHDRYNDRKDLADCDDQSASRPDSYVPLTDLESPTTPANNQTFPSSPGRIPSHKFSALYAYAMRGRSESDNGKDGKSVAGFAEPNVELTERAQSIKRLRGVLFHLIFFYFNCAAMSLLWAFGSRYINNHLWIGIPIEICFLAALWPSLTAVIFWRLLQMQKARERSERRSASAPESSDMPKSPSARTGGMPLSPMHHQQHHHHSGNNGFH